MALLVRRQVAAVRRGGGDRIGPPAEVAIPATTMPSRPTLNPVAIHLRAVIRFLRSGPRTFSERGMLAIP